MVWPFMGIVSEIKVILKNYFAHLILTVAPLKYENRGHTGNCRHNNSMQNGTDSPSPDLYSA